MLALSGKRSFIVYVAMCFCVSLNFTHAFVLSVLQEESSVKPEEQGPRSRFGPSTEDLTSASKQVDNANVDIRDPLSFYFMSVCISVGGGA